MATSASATYRQVVVENEPISVINMMRKLSLLLVMMIWLSMLSAKSEKSEITAIKQFTNLVGLNQYAIHFQDGQYVGEGFDFLLKAGQQAQFFMLGEEHGIAENPQLAAALLTELVAHGYQHLAVEVSPQMAAVLQDMATMGIQALQAMFKNPHTTTAFFGMREEADMLVQVMSAVKSKESVLWGLDYEVLGDRHLINQLGLRDMPEEASEQYKQLKLHALEAEQAYIKSHNPMDLMSFSADPQWVSALVNAWPEADADTQGILHTLYETYVINQLWINGKSWQSNQRRAELIKHHFLQYWQHQKQLGLTPKVFVKLGSSHVIRGRNHSGVFDLGTLLPELAATVGGHTFQLLVLPGPDSATAVFNPSNMSYRSSAPKDGYAKGLDLLINLAQDNEPVVLDLRPLRSWANKKQPFMTEAMIQTIHGYDALLVMNGSNASQNINSK